MSLTYYGALKRRYESKIEPERDFVTRLEAAAFDVERASDIVRESFRDDSLMEALRRPSPLFRAALDLLKEAAGSIPEDEDLPF
jgi:hypothetical protein